MKGFMNFFLSAVIIAVIFSACDSGPKPVPIEGMDTYKDEVAKFEIKYPSNWHMTSYPGTRLYVISDKSASNRFRFTDPAVYGSGFPGARIDLTVIPLDSNRTLDTAIAESKLFEDIYEESDITIDGMPGKKLTYAFGLEGGTFEGVMYAAAKDSGSATILTLEAFDGAFEQYRAQFDEILASLKLAETPAPLSDTLFVTEEADPPSTELKMARGKGFAIQIPDNFRKENIGKAAGAEESYSYLGMRRGDSYIKVDIFDASKTKDLKKIVDENKGKFAGSSAPKKVTLGGKEAYMMDYKPAGQIGGKIWFVLHNDKLYRVIINWFTGEEADFLPPFEKSVNTITFE